MWNTEGVCMNRTSKSVFPSLAAALTLVSSLAVLWFPFSLNSAPLVLASSALILLPLFIHAQLIQPGEQFLVLAHIKTSIEHQFMPRQIGNDPVIIAPFRATQ